MTAPSADQFRNSKFTGLETLSHWQYALALSLLLLITAALYFQVAHFEFLDYDDSAYVLKDPAIQHFGWDNLQSILFEPYAHVWYPIARLSAALDIFMFGHNAYGHHLTSVLLHFLNAVALFQILYILGHHLNSARASATLTFYPALLVVLLFITHPQHVEAATWVVQRKELLASLFSLIAIALYLKGKTFSVGFFVLLAMLSKPTAIVLPFFLILLRIILTEPKELSFNRIAGITLENWWGILLSICIAVTVFMNSEKSLWLNDAFPIPARSMLFADNVLHGLSRFVMLQAGLFHQPIAEYINSGSWLNGLSVVILVLLLGACCALLFSNRLSHRLAAGGFIFYCAALVPTGGLFLFGNYAFGDRYLYLGSSGLYIVVFVILNELLHKYRTGNGWRAIYTCAILVVCGAFLVSFQVLPKWASTRSVWTYDIDRHPGAVLANQKLGVYYFERRELQQALKHFAASIDSNSERFRVAPRVTSALYMAEIFCSVGRGDAAIQVLGQIPQMGGDISVVEDLLSSIQFSGYIACYNEIKHWYESTGA